MIIRSIETRRAAVPLKKPFKTALRTVINAETILVRIVLEDGTIGYGEAPPTVVITGDSLESIESFIQLVTPRLVGQNTLQYEKLLRTLHAAAVRNTSAKAAVEMALYDVIAKQCGVPLYQFLGGYRDSLETDYTVSVNDPSEMADDAASYVQDGFSVLKIKVGIDSAETDIKRIQAIRDRIGDTIKLRLDANQGWNAKDAIRAIRAMEDRGLGIELVEQPVKAADIEGLKQVTDNVETPIMADESVFSPADALAVLQRRAADLINIKLMKAGGIHRAETIARMADACGMECMVGSMIETRLGITAAAHFAASKPNITRFDFDAPLMLTRDIVTGGVVYDGTTLRLPNAPGLGITDVEWA